MIPNNHVYINMHYYCIICDREAETNPRNHRICGKVVQTLTINIPKNSDVDRIFYEHVIIRNKQYEYFTVEIIFKNEFETKDFCQTNTPNNNLEFYLNHLKFSHITQMIFKTISDIRNMTYKYYINSPMQMVERRLNMIIARNPHLINALDRRINHPLIRKYSNTI